MMKPEELVKRLPKGELLHIIQGSSASGMTRYCDVYVILAGSRPRVLTKVVLEGFGTRRDPEKGYVLKGIGYSVAQEIAERISEFCTQDPLANGLKGYPAAARKWGDGRSEPDWHKNFFTRRNGIAR